MDCCDCCGDYLFISDPAYEVFDFYGPMLLCEYCYMAECDDIGYHTDY